MEATAVQSAALAGSVNVDMSIWGLFLQADFVVKAVMIGLLLASFWCWAIIFEKVRRIRRLRLQASQFEETFWSGGSLDDLLTRKNIYCGSESTFPFCASFATFLKSSHPSFNDG